MANSSQSPVHESADASPRAAWQRPWIAWAAFGWLVILFLYLPYLNTSRSPPGAFLGLKIVTTVISAMAVVALICVPRGWWRAVTILVAGFLVFVQATAWISLP